MPLSLSELRDRATRFAREWAGETREHAESKPFWVDFFQVFDINRRRVASFEEPVKKLGGKQGFIDLFWKGLLLIEHKSQGKDLDKAYSQALDYFPGLPDYQLPKYILVSDFARFRLYDLEDGQQHEFALSELPDHLHLFAFLTGYQKRKYLPEDPANAQAAELLGQLHDAIRATGYGVTINSTHALEVLLVRLLFCCFAEDTAIFEKDAFRALLEEHTRDDGSDTGPLLARIFQVLDQSFDRRPATLPTYLAGLPYVNGALFRERFDIPDFDAALRKQLIRCTYFDWSRISPAVFGSLFQAVADPIRRRTLGAHYTSETNILKVLRPLLLDELYIELTNAGHNRRQLDILHRRLAHIRILDPSCGCGNFLVVAYRELRLLELEILRRQLAPLLAKGQTVNLSLHALIQVDQVGGIEIEEFPARIAEVAMWLIDHQLNLQLSEAFGEFYARLPLTRSAHIHHENALTFDWQKVFPDAQPADYIMGNPPFVGQTYQNEIQKASMIRIFAGNNMARSLDFVAAWYLKGAQYAYTNPNTRVAFVSTNSVTQGEQVAPLWSEMQGRYGMHIQFAHRTFAWANEARGKAAVHCVIIGYGTQALPIRSLFDYPTLKSEPQEIIVKNINAYLVDGPDVLVGSRTNPISQVPKMSWGSKPTDGGHFILSGKEREELLAREPGAASWIRPYMGGQELINGGERWCLWLINISPSELRQLPEVMKRVESVRRFRLASIAASTRAYADYPTLFRQVAQPDTTYLAIPEVSSERRFYIPIGFLSPNVIASNTLQTIPNSTLYHFGILTSAMHMTWMRQICGRLKSDYRYSNSLVYNNYPFPDYPDSKQVAAVEAAAQEVLTARALFPRESLANLYDPLTMPTTLIKAHQALDRIVDQCYRKAIFPTELSRLEYLFATYRQLTEPLIIDNVIKQSGRKLGR
jgi:hypothetical protein